MLIVPWGIHSKGRELERKGAGAVGLSNPDKRSIVQCRSLVVLGMFGLVLKSLNLRRVIQQTGCQRFICELVFFQ